MRWTSTGSVVVGLENGAYAWGSGSRDPATEFRSGELERKYVGPCGFGGVPVKNLCLTVARVSRLIRLRVLQWCCS
jgi:hypothetical protein